MAELSTDLMAKINGQFILLPIDRAMIKRLPFRKPENVSAEIVRAIADEVQKHVLWFVSWWKSNKHSPLFDIEDEQLLTNIVTKWTDAVANKIVMQYVTENWDEFRKPFQRQ
ncbi:MAG: hypothetical protein AMS21_00855 [Gemmatimonas sp. SG8_38_2]|nr:MAG: hypothetical protein AMS21_00855 [Gemmatimonas sp. SG8_38_2]